MTHHLSRSVLRTSVGVAITCLLTGFAAGALHGQRAGAATGLGARAAHPEYFPPRPFPLFFNLGISGTTVAGITTGITTNGATITAGLAKPHGIGLVIVKEAGTATTPLATGGTAIRAVPGPLVGYVPLGTAHAGENSYHWDFRVNGAPLGPGIYYSYLEIFGTDGRPTGSFNYDTAAMQFAANGQDCVQMWRMKYVES